jgi:sugar phosphate isomerase/epimerase
MIEIAADTGFDYVSLRLAPVTDREPHFPFTTDRGLVSDVIEALDATGISLLDVELIRTDPGATPESFRPFVEVSAEMGARHIITQIPISERGEAVERFQEVCELADPFGLTVDLEFIPWSPTADLDAAADIVTKAGRPNGGILVDTLHFSRSNSTVAQLSQLPAKIFNFIQLCDARAQVSSSHDELIRVARADRQLPGSGVIELGPIVDALPKVPYSLEVPNDTMRRELGALEYSRLVLETTRSFFDGVDAAATAAASLT